MPSSCEVELDNGQGFEQKNLVEHQFEEQNTHLDGDGLMPQIQAPYPTVAMHPFAYRSVFLLFDLGKCQPPSRVTLCSIAPGTNSQETREIAVTPTSGEDLAILHLTAKAVLIGLEGLTRGCDSNRAMLELARSNAERLGGLYSISSRWTSFVAVDQARQLVNEVEFHKARLLQIDMIDALRPSVRNDTPTLATSSSPSSILYGQALRIMGLGLNAPYLHNLEHKSIAQSYKTPREDYLERGPLIWHIHDEDQDDIESSIRYSNLSLRSPFSAETETDDIYAKLGSYQDARGTFHPSSQLTKALETHFCKHTLQVLAQTLVRNIPTAHILSHREEYYLIQTLMIVQYLQTHHCAERKLWDMMASKAEHAVATTVLAEGSEQLLSGIEAMLEDSTMHAHFRYGFFVGVGEPPMVSCPIAGKEGTPKPWLRSRDEHPRYATPSVPSSLATNRRQGMLTGRTSGLIKLLVVILSV